MKKILPLFLTLTALTQLAFTQVIRLSNNTNLTFGAPLNATKAVFIQAIDGQTDYQLWVTDGTAANTRKLNIPVTLESESGIAFLNDKMYFSGLNDANGAELWVTDGTDAGTSMVKDINTGASSSSPRGMIALNNNLYFFASTNALGTELWKSDGTSGGTVMLKDINIGAGGSYSDLLSYSFLNNELFFTAISATTGLELWKTNGTPEGTVQIKDINPVASSEPEFLDIYKNEIYFTADDAVHGRELWKTNGTLAGTVLVKDIAVGPFGSDITSTIILNDRLLFQAAATPADNELYASDGTTGGTGLVKDIFTGPVGSNPNITSGVQFGNKLIFAATSATTGRELFITDGTNAGTTLFKEIVPGMAGSDPSIWLDRNFFAAADNPNYNGNSTLYNGKIFFSISTMVNNLPSSQLWITDGTAANTVMVKDFGIAGLIFQSYYYTLSGLYFTANDANKGYEIFKSQGTLQTTSLYADVYEGEESSNAFFQFFSLNGKVFFIADDGDSPNNDFDLFVLSGNESPLPVQRLQFAAASIKEGVDLTWVTSNEHNTKLFEIERSADGNLFTSISNVSAARNTNGDKSYAWLDKDAYAQKTNTLYYRLKQVDQDGKFTYSRVAIVKLNAIPANGWQLSPNPATNVIRVNITLQAATTAQLNIINTSGQVVKQLNTKLVSSNNQQVIGLEGLPAGLYYVQLVTGSGKIESLRFVKQ